MSNAVITHAEGRKATWFELFFDLVFVIGVAALTGQFAAQYDVEGALRFAFLLLILWWLWLGNTFHASRFDKDRPEQWAFGFVQMIAVVFIAYGAGDAFGARPWAFAGGVAAFKLLLAGLGNVIKAQKLHVHPAVQKLLKIHQAAGGVPFA